MAVQLESFSASGRLTRREFLWITGIAGTAFAVGCMVNPVTGKQQLMLVSREQEIALDRESSPHQFSADYGPVQDTALNQYVSKVGLNVAAHSHRPDMPYSFRCVNACYANAYAFPGGSIATTRGLLVNLNNEAELAALLGHEIGHVNARHTAQQMTKKMMLGIALAIGTVVVAEKNKKYAPLAAGLGAVGAGALLAHYSRNDERQADQLGMKYMVRSGYNPEGMVQLMEVLQSMSKRKPGFFEQMFASHPMSSERFVTAKSRVTTLYAEKAKLPFFQERFMDHTVKLRRLKPAIEAFENGSIAITKKKYAVAETQLKKGLKLAPRDYTGLTLMAKLQLTKENYARAELYAKKAESVYPGEAQAHHVAGVAELSIKRYEEAYADFDRYEKLLPGNPNTLFFKGLSQEGMQHKRQAAFEYQRFLKVVSSGEQAGYARDRLVSWGFMKEPAPATE
ncbi:MAG: M48 family metalloprotease [Acidobacteria bacterium]|nr:M48 family metalloprotease [Acidobacteriota bacterium]